MAHTAITDIFITFAIPMRVEGAMRETTVCPFSYTLLYRRAASPSVQSATAKNRIP